MTPQELVAARSALLAARVSGTRTVRFGEDEITYKSDSEMAAALAAIDREIAGLTGARVRTFLPTFSKGFEN